MSHYVKYIVCLTIQHDITSFKVLRNTRVVFVKRKQRIEMK
jgi:hypothetical protein